MAAILNLVLLLQIWLLMNYLFRNLKSHLHGPDLQTMNRRKLLLKRDLHGRTDSSIFKA